MPFRHPSRHRPQLPRTLCLIGPDRTPPYQLYAVYDVNGELTRRGPWHADLAEQLLPVLQSLAVNRWEDRLPVIFTIYRTEPM